MKILFFDTETNGLPRDYKGSIYDVDNWPRVIQLSWQVSYTQTGYMFSKYNHLIKPDGWEIPKESFWIDNGFSTEENHLKGSAMDYVLDAFIACVQECDLLVAHNMAFDYNVLGAEMIRYGKKSERKVERFCTMEASIKLCKIPFGNDRRPWINRRRGYKWPKLEQLPYGLRGRKSFSALLTVL